MIADDAMLAGLMARSQDGDRAAYGVLLQECQRWLKRYFARRIPPAGLDDLVQDTLISLHRKRASYDPARPFLPWLAAIARYRWIDQLRRHYRQDAVSLDADLAIDPQVNPVIARLSVDRLLALLPARQEEAIRLVKIDGLSIAEASERCGQSQPLVKVNIHRGLKKLANMVEKA